MNAIIYCRVSSKEQVEGTSLESQKLACEEYARAKGFRVLKVFTEHGESAKFADRTQLVLLIDYCRQNRGQVDILLVWKVDRFARNVGDHFQIKAVLAKAGVQVVSVTEPIDAQPAGKLMETILAGFAEFDNDVRASRTVLGMRRKLQEGISPWRTPLGYKSSRSERGRKNAPDEPDEPTFGLLQRAWRVYMTGNFTIVEIGRMLALWGLSSPSGSALSKQTLSQIFRNPFYSGILIDPWTNEEVTGRHKAMVSREEFAIVQHLSQRRKQSVPHIRHRPEFPLRGFARCNLCGRCLTASFSKGRKQRYGYYRCNARRCQASGKSTSVRSVHEEFSAFLETITPTPKAVNSLAKMIDSVAFEQAKSTEVARGQLREKIKRIEKELAELVRMRAQGLLTDDEFLVNRSAMLTERNTLEAQRAAYRIDPEIVRDRLGYILSPLRTLHHTCTTLSMSRRPRFQRLILPFGFQIDNIGTAEIGLLFKTLCELSRGGSTKVPLQVSSWNQLCQEIQGFYDILTLPEAPPEPPKRSVRRKN